MEESKSNNFNWSEDTWKVLDNYFSKTDCLVRHQLNSYNTFIEKGIPRILKDFNPIKCYDNNSYSEKYEKYMTEYHVEFDSENVYMGKPIIKEENGEIKPMYPRDARLRNLTYSGMLKCNIKQRIITYNEKNEKNIKELSVIKGFNLTKIPVMLQSKYCVLNDQTSETKKEMGECMYDNGGYFIMKGSEKVLTCQEKKCYNKIYVFKTTRQNQKYSDIAEISSVNTEKSSIAYEITVNYKSKPKKNIDNDRNLYVGISKFTQHIPLFVVFRALGIISDKEILDYISDDKLILNELLSSLRESEQILEQNIALEYMSKFITIPLHIKNNASNIYKLKYTKEILNNNLFPHVGNNNRSKALFLGKMVEQLLSCVIGNREYDDRDSFINKRVESAGILMGNLFRSNYNTLVKNLRSQIDKDIRKGAINEISDNLSKKIKPTLLENGITYALATGNWGLKNQSNKKGVAQLLNRFCNSAFLSHLRRCLAPIDRTIKSVDPRKLHNTHWGRIGPCETPEGGSVGIVKNLALMTVISDSYDINPLLSCLEEFGVRQIVNISFIEIKNKTKIIVNGNWYGVHENPYELRKKIVELRRKGVIHPFISVSWNIELNEIVILSDEGRLLRPLYIVENNKLLITKKDVNELENGTKTFEDLLINFKNTVSTDVENINSAVIEYLDTEEENTMMVAMTENNLKLNNKDNNTFCNYTHCEIHPSMIFGILSSSIPFADHNQAPRVLFQGAMGKQAMGLPFTNFYDRFDSSMNIMYYPQTQLVSTRSAHYSNKNKLPSGQIPIVAIQCYTGYNQEDSLIMNQDSIDRGLFLSSYYKTYKDEEKKNQSSLEEEKFMKPVKYREDNSLLTIGMKSGSYANLNDNGFIKVGSVVKSGDVIIGKTIPLKVTNESSSEPIYKDASTIIKSNEKSIVDRIYVNKNGQGYKFCKVRIRSERPPIVGDKFSSQHGQKGTVGIKYRRHNMPFTKDGIVPDLIVNPHAIPSRMTIGHLIDCLGGKVSSLFGYEIDATPFLGQNVSKLGEIMEKIGYDKFGNETLYDGTTGKQIKVKIFIGPTYYQRLKHMVNDKIHSRTTGPYQILTHQPSDGRGRDGGLRLGEMERDTLLTHGTMAFIKERMFDNSDKYMFYVCKKCGLIAIGNKIKKIFKCTFCEDSTDFAEVNIPYSTKLFLQELMSLTVAPRLTFN